MNQDLNYFANLIKDFSSCYLAGGIQKKSRPDQWRQDIKEFFKKNERKVNNPVEDNEEIFNASIMGYKTDGSNYTLDELVKNNEVKWAMLLKQTEENDFYFIANSDLLIFYLDDSAGVGTATEFMKNYDNYKKPFIIVRTISRNNLPHWVGWRRYNALIKDKVAIEFKTLTEMKEFFKEYLKFKL